ncbi:MAG: class I SAM-dependent methyltransferase [Kangiella sp.]|jgi:ubiquinone/menaquinone biosynthesis C-methylase UbiE|nr:class I SAM-dependent methyltransferase [Kangiella sp.]MCW9028934.1 class I SAM-dependent methyltransferase [Kangiella sp.]
MNFQEVESVKQSLELGSHRLIDFLPYLYQDFSELGTNTGYMMELVDELQKTELGKRVLDLCCGKGVTLINLAKQYGWQGIGVDVVEDFIEQAKIDAHSKRVHNQTEFIRQNIADFLKHNTELFDVIVFPASTDVLGDITESLNILSENLNDDGFVLVESDYKSHSFNIGSGLELSKNIDDLIAASKLHSARKIVWEQSIIIDIYRRDTQRLTKRVNELKRKQPELRRELDLFIEHRNEHLQHYVDNEIARSSWLLTKHLKF